MKEFKKFREALGLTISEMANVLGISKSYLEKLETGHKQPSRNVMCKIKAKYPQFDMNFFLV